MHICLLSIEILVDIFAATYDTRWGQGSLGTLAALARTCKEFKEPALNILWKDIHGFGPLVLCLPEGVRGITEQGQLTLTRPLFSGEWKIFNSYACRIRSLFIYSKLLDEIDGQVMKVLVSAPSPTLLPNLHSLEWWDGRDFFLPLLHALLAPTIKSMKLYSHPEEPWEPSFAKSTLLISLGARCPHIQEFVCPYSCDSDEHSDAMNDTVCCWSKLIHLETGVLNTQALAHLTSSPSLKFLDFMSCGSVNDTKPDSIPIFTSKLDKVSIAAPSFPILIQCLRSVHFITCRSVVLSVYDHDSLLSRPLDIPDLFVSFAECFSSTLEQFAVHFPGLGHISTEKLVGPPFMLAFTSVNSALRPSTTP
ncbi:hypothetical protein K503DRAFT_486684 [Rhizopogon vinicolor AM-OR11-026]|uniref:F-box domain-containing protein n=1 Tax=Rhizopogon vinicolor AM-OR11-026 TaxID=1314800 RepID=A0A1B7MMQ4_9AGAM|nr:hypothetical protein K503DRAFT_486684 [Rhizopogon vinicolor AM-OR11-026]